MKLSEFSIQRPITTLMVTLSVLVLGAISLQRLPLEYLPDFTWPAMYINVNYPSSSPEEVEQEITRPIEEVMGTLPHVKSISASSYDNRSSIRLEFEFATDMDLMAVHVRDRLDQVRGDLPDDVEQIRIRRWNTEDFPILRYAITWLGPNQEELSQVFDHVILPRLQRLEGVGNVEMRGLEEKALLVEVDQNLLNTHKLDIRGLNRAISSNNVNLSAGYVRDAEKRLAVRAVGEFDQVSQIRELPLRDDLTIDDVADVSYDYPERTSFERLGGRNAISLDVRKSSTANLVATANRVKRETERIIEEVGRDKLRAQIVRDRSLDVTGGIRNLTQSAVLGGLLAISVIFLFLRNFRSTVIIGSAIPISALCVFMIMYLLRQLFDASITLNLISMMGLMVAVGMLVDPAVVALENIFRKRFDEGQDAWTAAMEGSKEIGMPVLAASMTTICVFIPIVFVTDSRTSLIMRDFALTVCISVVASFCVAMTLIPLAGSRIFKDGSENLERRLKVWAGLAALCLLALVSLWVGPGELMRWAYENFSRFLGGLAVIELRVWITLGIVAAAIFGLYYAFRHVGIKQLYTRVITTTLRYRWTTVAAASILLAFAIHIYGQIENQPYRWQPTRRVTFTVEMPRNYALEDAIALFEGIEILLLPKKAELDIDAVSTRYSDRRSNRITLYLVPPDQGTLTTDEVKRKVTALLPKDIPGVRFKSGRTRGSNSTGVGLDIKGRDLAVLEMLAEDIEIQMQGMQGVHDIETSLESGKEEIRVTVNRQRALRYGLSPRQIATTVATSLGTRGSSKFKTDQREIDITVQLREEDRTTLEQLKNAQFESDAGNLVSFGTLADFQLQKGPKAITREDRMATVTVFANTEQSAIYRVGREMMGRMESIPLPNGYSWKMGRSFRRMAQEQGETNFTIFFAIILIYLIMASLFESYVHPFTILFSIGFGFIGVVFGLYIFNIPMDSNASYGLLILFGIVVNNGIVLVDHINRYRQKGLARIDAIIRGGQDRLRPILMTATTTILGLTPLVVPMVYGMAEGTARRWGPIGLVVISGLAVSTILTLVILPTIYSLIDDLANRTKRVVALALAR